MCSHTPWFSTRVLMSIVGLLLAGCGTHSGLGARDAGGGDSVIPSGGNTGTVSVGGAGGNGASGGATILGSAGDPASAGGNGGAPPASAGIASGGLGAFSSGGAAGSASDGGAGGASLVASSTVPISCAGVTCPALPKSCKKVVQDPTACCPACTDTGCPACDPISCLSGTHSETLPGDCCPSCVADPPDACKKGQQAYAELRKQLLDKYGSTKCQNSPECTLVQESNACAAVCNVPLPTSTAGSYRDNLDHVAVNCASCPAQNPIQCERMVAACLNGQCVAVDPS